MSIVIMGCVICFMFLLAALFTLIASIFMMNIHSVSGDTIAEEFYWAAGLFVSGVSIFMSATGLLTMYGSIIVASLARKTGP